MKPNASKDFHAQARGSCERFYRLCILIKVTVILSDLQPLKDLQLPHVEVIFTDLDNASVLKSFSYEGAVRTSTFCIRWHSCQHEAVVLILGTDYTETDIDRKQSSPPRQ